MQTRHVSISTKSQFRGPCAECDCNSFDGGDFVTSCLSCGHSAESHMSLLGTESLNLEESENDVLSDTEQANAFILRLRENITLQTKLFYKAAEFLEKCPELKISEVFSHALSSLSDVELSVSAIHQISEVIDERVYKPANGGISDDELSMSFATQPYAKSGMCTFLTQCQWNTNVCNTGTCFACS